MRWGGAKISLQQVALALWVLASPVLAADEPAQRWEALLGAAQKLATETVRIAGDEKVQAARAREAARWLPQAPELSVSHRTDQWLSDLGGREWEVELAAPLWQRGQRSTLQKLSSDGLRLLEAEKARLEWSLAQKLNEAVWLVREQGAKLQAAQARFAVAEKLSADVQRRVAAGDLAETDGLLAQGERLAALAEQEDARVALQGARAQLGLLVGSSNVELPRTDFRSVDREAPHFSYENHPRWQEAHARFAIARLEFENTRFGGEPVKAGISWTQSKDTSDEVAQRMVGVSVSIPLGGQSRQALSRAEANTAMVSQEVELARLRAALTATFEQAIRARSSAARQAEQIAEQLALSERTVALSKRAFEVGELDLPAWLRLQQSASEIALQSELKSISLSRYEFDLRLAQGQIPWR
ncbi:putative outer membrane protein [gamma proteobacterium HdN1]|nr:putative outer membrane protein [gamma proteobacterium HdN1]